jgi:hypothetical protein
MAQSIAGLVDQLHRFKGSEEFRFQRIVHRNGTHAGNSSKGKYLHPPPLYPRHKRCGNNCPDGL